VEGSTSQTVQAERGREPRTCDGRSHSAYCTTCREEGPPRHFPLAESPRRWVLLPANSCWNSGRWPKGAAGCIPTISGPGGRHVFVKQQHASGVLDEQPDRLCHEPCCPARVPPVHGIRDSTAGPGSPADGATQPGDLEKVTLTALTVRGRYSSRRGAQGTVGCRSPCLRDAWGLTVDRRETLALTRGLPGASRAPQYILSPGVHRCHAQIHIIATHTGNGMGRHETTLGLTQCSSSPFRFPSRRQQRSRSP